MKAAYRSLFIGSLELLELDSAYWTEKLLLRLIHRLSRQRLQEIKAALPGALTGEAEIRLKENMMEAQVEAALAGHQLGQWEGQEDGGYQAVCSRCGGSIYVSHRTLYSILEDSCLEEPQGNT